MCFIFSSFFSFFFFFKQKTAYEMLRSLVGSEMCIRDRSCSTHRLSIDRRSTSVYTPESVDATTNGKGADTCLLYTSDAADDLLCVDLGGRSIIKKKKNVYKDGKKECKEKRRHSSQQ